MIARLSGRLARKSSEALIIDVHGVGYRVLVSLTTFAALPAEGVEVTLGIHTHLRETALELFGFLEPAEQALFGALITVSGIGPRMALNILSGLAPDELINALAGGNVARLVAIPGVGKRTAERLVVELQDRMQKLREKPSDPAETGEPLTVEAVSALVNLGYREVEADRAVRAVVATGAVGLAEVIRQALRKLSG